MHVNQLHAWAMKTSCRRAALALVCVWIAGIIGVALWSAIDHELEFYHRTMLGLLIVGVPLGMCCIGYAFQLLGKTGVKWVMIAVLIISIALISLAYLQHQREVQAKEELERHQAAVKPPSEEDWQRVFAGIEADRRKNLSDAGYSDKVIDQVVPPPNAEPPPDFQATDDSQP